MPALNWHPDALRDVERLHHFLAGNIQVPPVVQFKPFGMRPINWLHRQA